VSVENALTKRRSMVRRLFLSERHYPCRREQLRPHRHSFRRCSCWGTPGVKSYHRGASKIDHSQSPSVGRCRKFVLTNQTTVTWCKGFSRLFEMSGELLLLESSKPSHFTSSPFSTGAGSTNITSSLPEPLRKSASHRTRVRNDQWW